MTTWHKNIPQPEIGQFFDPEELIEVREMIASLPFKGTKWEVSAAYTALAELISITPRAKEAWWPVRGVDGAKGEGRGERDRARHAPDTGLGIWRALELVSISPPGAKEAWWQIWKALDGRIMVDTLWGTEYPDYGRMAEALTAVRKELLLWGPRGK